MSIYQFEGKTPVIDESSYVHPEAIIIGDVEIGKSCYVGACAVIRGDWGKIVIKDGSNVQENCVIHTMPDCIITFEEKSHIGHGASIHGASLGRNVLVGMKAVLQDNSYIGENSIIGAGAVLAPNSKIPPGKVVVGVPAKIKGDVTEELAERKKWGTSLYLMLPERCKKGLKKQE